MRSSLTLFGTANPAASTAVAGLSVAPASGSDDPASASRVARAIAAAQGLKTVYMTSSTSCQGARIATLNAAKDLYGASSTQYTTVAAAWSAVSVS